MDENKKICPFCGEEININAIKCKYCKEFLNKDENKAKKALFNNNVKNFFKRLIPKKLPSKKIIFITLAAVAAIVAVSIIYETIRVANYLPTCDSLYAEIEVKAIFEQNNPAYARLGSAYVEFSSPEPIRYDEKIKRYECEAIISMYNSEDYDKTGKKATYRKCKVKYSIFKVNGENKVKSTYCKYGFDSQGSV